LEFNCLARDKSQKLKLLVAVCLKEVSRLDSGQSGGGEELNAKALVA
jgi:hypothetical protein